MAVKPRKWGHRKVHGAAVGVDAHGPWGREVGRVIKAVDRVVVNREWISTLKGVETWRSRIRIGVAHDYSAGTATDKGSEDGDLM